MSVNKKDAHFSRQLIPLSKDNEKTNQLEFKGSVPGNNKENPKKIGNSPELQGFTRSNALSIDGKTTFVANAEFDVKDKKI